MASFYSQVTGGHIVLGDERLLRVDNFIDAVVGVEVGLDGVENHDGAVGTSTTVYRRVVSMSDS